MAFIMLASNLNSYKSLFKSNEELHKKLMESLNKGKDHEFGSLIKPIMLVLTSFICLFFLIFYIVSANVFIEQKILLGYSIYLILKTIVSWLKVVKFFSDEKMLKRSLLSRVLIPVNTTYLIYFIYFYINTL